MVKIKVFSFFVFFFIVLFCYSIFNSPYNTIRNYNEDIGISPFTYLAIYKTVLPKQRFDKLIDSLVTGNMDIPSIDIVTEFCVEKKLYEYIPLIEAKCNLFETFPKDSSWVVEITERYRRESAISELNLSNNFCENLNKLKKLQLKDKDIK